MNKWYRILSLVIFLIIVIYPFIKSSPSVKTAMITPYPTSLATPSATIVVANTTGACHIRGVLPDPSCTPGAIDANVTQNNIDQTICVKGYTKTVRPPVSYTNALKVKQIVAYGYADTDLKDYEEDHLISLELGGSPTDPKNLWPEPGSSPNPKDKIENICHDKVCSGQISLLQAQQEIATNWQTACQ